MWKTPGFFLTHPLGVAAFGREATYRGVPPVVVSLFGAQFITWRGIPIVPSDKVPVEKGKTKFILVRTGEERQGVVGLFQPGLVGEQAPGLSVRFTGHQPLGDRVLPGDAVLARSPCSPTTRWPCSTTWRWTSSMSTSEYRSVDAEGDLPISEAELAALASQLFASARPGPDSPPQTTAVAPRGNVPDATAATSAASAAAGTADPVSPSAQFVSVPNVTIPAPTSPGPEPIPPQAVPVAPRGNVPDTTAAPSADTPPRVWRTRSCCRG